MRVLAPLLLLALSTPAHALTSHQVGTWVDLVGGLAADTSLAAHAGWQASAGGWFGPYDNAYAIGRYHGIGLTLRQDLAPGTLRTNLEIEARRGMDLIVVGVYGYLSGGAEIVGGDLGAAAHLGVGGKWRFLPHWSATLRLDVGVGTAAGVHGTLGLVLGVGWSRPLAGVEDLGWGLPGA